MPQHGGTGLPEVLKTGGFSSSQHEFGRRPVKESRDRVKSAMKNCGFNFPTAHITINPVSYTHLYA